MAVKRNAAVALGWIRGILGCGLDALPVCFAAFRKANTCVKLTTGKQNSRGPL
jgi:hypothetical protein